MRFLAFSLWFLKKILYSISWESWSNVSEIVFRLTYVRNAAGLIKDKGRLAHILVTLFITIWMSNRIISGIMIQQSTWLDYNGGLIKLTRKFCMKTNTSGTNNTIDNHPHINLRVATITTVTTIIFNIVLTFCYFTVLKTRYLSTKITFEVINLW